MTVQFKLTAPSGELDSAIEHAINTKTKPLGSLGQESIAAQIAKIQQTLTPKLSGGSLVLLLATTAQRPTVSRPIHSS